MKIKYDILINSGTACPERKGQWNDLKLVIPAYNGYQAEQVASKLLGGFPTHRIVALKHQSN